MMHCLTYRKLLQIDGNFDEILAYLQAIITNNVNKLKTKNSIYALFLTPQGKIITDVFIYNIDGVIFLDVCEKVYDEIFNKLKMYSIGREITLSDAEYAVYLSDSDVGNFAVSDVRIPQFYRIVMPYGFDELEGDAYKKYRVHLISNLMPEFDDHLESAKFFPLDFSMDEIAGSIDYEKGCYVGQEVTARSKYRGVKRKSLKITSSEEGVLINAFDDKELVLVRG